MFSFAVKTPMLGIKKNFLCYVQKLFDVVLSFVTTGSNFRRYTDDAAQERLFPHDTRMVVDIGRGGPFSETSQVGASPHGVELSPILKTLAQGDEIRRFAPVRKLDHRAENLAM